MMSAYSVMDSVNKYRHGVLLGNYVEDKFGSDLASQVLFIFILGTSSRFYKASHNERSSWPLSLSL